jgi:CheY-like chemotaxis protein
MLPEECDSGPAGLRKLREAAERNAPFDLAILDLMMPDMDGFELARIIKQDPLIANTRLVMLTSYGRRGHSELANQIGIAAYQAKPVRQSQLFGTLVRVMERESRGGTMKPKAADEQSTPVLSKSDNRRPVSSKKILLAEDNIVNQKVAVLQLQKLGYKPDVAANGREAVNAVSKNTYDLILMDCQMPEMDGYEATAEIRRIDGVRRRTPIIAMTAHALAGEREKCLDADMDDYIAKPVTTADLEAKINAWLHYGESGQSTNKLPDVNLHHLPNTASDEVRSEAS